MTLITSNFMGIASASFTVYVRDENPLILAEGLLRFFNSRLLQPKSMEIHLPGRRFEKLERSIDGDLFWGKDPLPMWLPGESGVAGTEFTALDKADNWLTIPRDLPRIIERLRTYCEESARLWQSKQVGDDDIYWAFWGLCRLVYQTNGSKPKEGYILRQNLRRAEQAEPILRVVCHLTQHPRPCLMLTLSIRSFVWSHYTSEFDTAKNEWIAKSQLQLEHENARLLAETVSEFVRQYPNAEIEWETGKEHSPDLRGFVTSEFQLRLGLPKSPKPVSSF